MKGGNVLGNLHNYVKLYENILDEETCQDIMSVVENATFEDITNENFKFKQAIVTENSHWELPEVTENEITTTPLHLQDVFSELFFSAASNYFQGTQLPLVPELQGFENIKIKKFTDQHFYNLHSDVNDHKSAKRFLSVFVFLTDAENGYIRFPTLGITDIIPKKGSILVFPPHWLYPYEVKCRDGGSLMYAHSYLHYV
jgi:hypothetical protein